MSLQGVVPTVATPALYAVMPCSVKTSAAIGYAAELARERIVPVPAYQVAIARPLLATAGLPPSVAKVHS